MRKKNLFRMLTFGIVFMLFGCSQELYDDDAAFSNKTSIREVKFKELYKEAPFKNLLEKVSRTSNAARTSFENQNGFTISDGFVKVIETDSVLSYTMFIERENVADTLSFENLVIYENKFSASEKAFSIKYTPTTIEPSGHDSFYYEGTEEIKSLAFTGFNRVGENAIETSNCYVNVIQVWCSQPFRGSTSHHIATAQCSPSTQYYKVVSIISPDDCEDSGSSSGGSSGSNNTDAPQEPTGPGNTGGITSPVNPSYDFGAGQTYPNTPCGRMQKNTNKKGFKEKFKQLNTNENYMKRFETGYYEKRNGTFNFMTGIDVKGKRTLNFEIGTTSFMHIHMNDVNFIDADGNPDTELVVKMLSPGDVGSVASAAGNLLVSGLDPLEAYGVMLSNEGIFSLTITDTNIAWSLALEKQLNIDYAIKATEIFKNTNPNSLKRKEKLQKMLLGLLKDKGLGDKFALFEAEVITEPGQLLPTINWIKKSLDANNELIEEPC
jgi:hypothetical protein